MDNGFDGGDEEDGKKAVDYRKIFKTIMYPGDNMSKGKGQRWPYSNVKANTKLGNDSLYAHHPMELQFPQTLEMRASGIRQAKKKDVNGPLKPMSFSLDK